MFLTPALPMTRNLLSHDDVKDIKQKIEAVKQFAKRKRAQTEEIKPFVKLVDQFYRSVLLTETWIYREKSRNDHFGRLKFIAIYEDLIIEYVINGKDLKTLLQEKIYSLRPSDVVPAE